ncbi:MAG: hypothetical protein ACRD0D_15815 [Acidimicrobiales bacterium]
MIADMEAGIEHLSWAGGTLKHVDLLMVVTEPKAKSMLTARRTHRLARDLGIARIAFIGNSVRPGDEGALDDFANELDAEVLAMIPLEEAFRRADQAGRCSLDAAPEAAGVRAIEELAFELERRFLGGRPGGPVPRATT